MYFFKCRSFIAKNLGLVGWRAAKLLAIKFGGLKKKSAAKPRLHSNRSAHIWERPQSLMAGNFTALWPTVFKFLSSKDQKPFKKYIINQVASSILRMVFALWMWPHLHKAYQVTVCSVLTAAVCTFFCIRFCLLIPSPYKLHFFLFCDISIVE